MLKGRNRRDSRDRSLDVGHHRVSAAQPPAGRVEHHGASARRGVPATVLDRRSSRSPGFDDNTSDGAGGAAQPAQQSTSPARRCSPRRLGRKSYQKGLQTFVWKADDENDDRLEFDVFYRREGETTWKPLKHGLWDPIFVWDTTSVPDGTYYVKIAASDAPSNSPATALVGELESVSFDVDNTPPVVEVQSATRSGQPRRASSSPSAIEQSAVQRVEYSLDAQPLARGVSGRRDRRFTTRGVRGVDRRGGSGARSIIIRATDAMNNVATAVARNQEVAAARARRGRRGSRRRAA